MATKKEKEISREDKKKEIDEDAEHLRQVDLPGGADYFKQHEDSVVKETKEMESNVLSTLQNKSKHVFAYRRGLVKYAESQIDDVDLPEGWEISVIPTDGSRIRVYGQGFDTKEGLVFVMRDNKGQVYIKAMMTSMEIEKDFHYVKNIVLPTIENTIDSAKGLMTDDTTGMKKTKSGILLA